MFVVGLAKSSKVLQRYQLALNLERVLPAGGAHYLRVPRELEGKAYRWIEWAAAIDPESDERRKTRYAAGVMHLVRFGKRATDPIWTIDILESQVEHADEIMSHLLADAELGFPVQLYPRSVQLAHQHRHVSDFDLAIVQDEVTEAVRKLLAEDQRDIVDVMRFAAQGFSGGRS